MGRKPVTLSDEDKKRRKQEYNKKYRESENGRNKTQQANLRYQKTETYLNYKREYEKQRRINSKE